MIVIEEESESKFFFFHVLVRSWDFGDEAKKNIKN